jgi:hypothetical protein
MDASPDRARRTRRRGAAAFGLIALPVVGTAFVLPAVANATTAPTTVTSAAVAPAGNPTTVDADQAQVQAYLDAGYSFDDATALAERWGVADFYQLKVKAGGFLRDGVALRDTPFATPEADDTFTPEQLVDVFVFAGYTVADAEVLAERWGVDLTEAKVRAGSELKTVGALPFVDAAVAADPGQDAVNAFFDAGYDYDDAVALAGFWGLPEPYDAKVKAGTWIDEGQALPTVPGVGN